MSEGNRVNRVRRILEQKLQPPEWQRMELEPEEAGRSRLHDEHGIPKVSNMQKKDIPRLQEISNEPVKIKASERNNPSHIATMIPNKGMPVKTSEQDYEDDGFIPPKNNFVSVGQVEHAWYGDRVAGPKREMIDNNDNVDNIEKLQGLNPMDLESKDKNSPEWRFKRRLENAFQNILAQLETVVNMDQFKVFRTNVFGDRGIFSKILAQFNELSQAERRSVGEFVNNFIDSLELEFGAKEAELNDDLDEEEEFDEEGYDQMVAEEEEEEGEDTVTNERFTNLLKPTDIAVFVDGKLVKVLSGRSKNVTTELSDLINQIIVGNNINLDDLDRIEVVKRLPINFGVNIGD